LRRLLPLRAQMIQLLVRQDSRVLGKARQVTVGGQQFLRVISETIIERVYKVQTHRSRD